MERDNLPLGVSSLVGMLKTYRSLGETLNTKLTSILVGLVLVLSGCSSAPAPTEAPEPSEANSDISADAIQIVKERYEQECFAGLGDQTEYRYEENPGGTMREGFVFATVGGNTLQFSVGMNENSGSFLTLPTDDATITLLESVGC